MRSLIPRRPRVPKAVEPRTPKLTQGFLFKGLGEEPKKALPAPDDMTIDAIVNELRGGAGETPPGGGGPSMHDFDPAKWPLIKVEETPITDIRVTSMDGSNWIMPEIEGQTLLADAYGMEKVLGKMRTAPDLFAFTLRSPVAREAFSKLIENKMRNRGNVFGIPSEQAVETTERLTRQRMVGMATEGLREEWIKYRMRVAGKEIPETIDRPTLQKMKLDIQDAAARGYDKLVGDQGGTRPMTYRQFVEEVARTKRRWVEERALNAPMEEGRATQFLPDADIEAKQCFFAGEEHPQHPEVLAAVRMLHDKVFDPTLEALVKYGLVPEELLNDMNYRRTYVPQMWNIEMIRHMPNKFRTLAGEVFRREMGLPQMDRLTAKERAKLKRRVDMYVRRVESSPDGYRTFRKRGKTGKARFEKPRELRIPPDMLDLFEPFLENDIERVLMVYLRAVNPDIHLMEKFGSLSLRKVGKEIKNEYDSIIHGLAPGTEKEKAALAKERDGYDHGTNGGFLYGRGPCRRFTGLG